MNKVLGTACLVALVAAVHLPVHASEPEILTLEGARIRGNQELPTVLYVVPWKPPEVRALEKPSQSFALQQPLVFLERDEFKRLIKYHSVYQSTLETKPETTR